MRPILKYDLICSAAMACVAAGVVLNILFLQALSSDGPSVLVLIPVGVGLVTPFLTYGLRRLARARHSRFMEAMAAGSLLYLFGSGMLSASLPTYLQP